MITDNQTQPPAVDLDQTTLWRGPDRRRLIDGVSWRVPRGTCCAVLGPNGAGKSTLLAIINGFLWPQRGTVSVLGEHYGHTDLPKLRERIGMLGHSRLPEFHPEMTALETVVAGRWGTIVIPPHRRPSAGDLEAARRELATTGMLEREETPYGRLSSGEQVRVLLARAVVARPELLVLDEPTVSLDMTGRAAFTAAIDRLLSERPSLSVVLVTHHVEDLPCAVHDVLLLKAGRTVASGPIASALTSPSLSRTFGCQVELFHEDGRYWTRVRPGETK